MKGHSYALVDCSKVSLDDISKTTRNPLTPLEVGVFQNRFYQIDHAHRTIRRITRGAYEHLRDTWQSWRSPIEFTVPE